MSQLEKEYETGLEAQQLIANPVFRSVMDDLENEIDSIVLSVDTTDLKLCADVIIRRQIFESIKRKLANYIQSGKMAQEMMEAERETEEKEKEIKR